LHLEPNRKLSNQAYAGQRKGRIWSLSTKPPLEAASFIWIFVSTGALTSRIAQLDHVVPRGKEVL
jgi:hypothetical protein